MLLAEHAAKARASRRRRNMCYLPKSVRKEGRKNAGKLQRAIPATLPCRHASPTVTLTSMVARLASNEGEPRRRKARNEKMTVA